MKPETRYSIIRELSRDALGPVSESIEMASGQLGALKQFDAWATQNEANRANYLASIQALAAAGPARTPRPLAVHMGAEDAWLATDAYAGTPLATYLQSMKRLPLEVAAGVACGLLDAIAELGDAGVYHGGLSAQKVLLTQGFSPASVVVADPFQNLLYAGSSPLVRAQVGNASFFGDAHYLAPEQARGQGADIRSDIYAVGVLLFEMLTGKRPFEGEPADVLHAHAHTVAPTLASQADGESFSEDLEFILATALAKDPSARFQAPLAMRRALGHTRASVDEDTERAATPLNRTRGEAIAPLFIAGGAAAAAAAAPDAGAAAAAAAPDAGAAAAAAAEQAAAEKAAAEQAAAAAATAAAAAAAAAAAEQAAATAAAEKAAADQAAAAQAADQAAAAAAAEQAAAAAAAEKASAEQAAATQAAAEAEKATADQAAAAAAAAAEKAAAEKAAEDKAAAEQAAATKAAADEAAATTAATAAAEVVEGKKPARKGKDDADEAAAIAASVAAFKKDLRDETVTEWFDAGKNSDELERLHGEPETPSLTQINKKYQRIGGALIVAIVLIGIGIMAALVFLGNDTADTTASESAAPVVEEDAQLG